MRDIESPLGITRGEFALLRDDPWDGFERSVLQRIQARFLLKEIVRYTEWLEWERFQARHGSRVRASEAGDRCQKPFYPAERIFYARLPKIDNSAV
ncbi:hypothetical protein KTD08_07080 [Burkholderia multivorans]|uniref:hypothetical protein n=1 Tax=Burkholderia multivorans TaxID=87883 RepID=UPI001C23D12D|nr:hypothetical protein [Burkholderia multivorans]MBU9124963.1 hypothetical protein [Burkholderia multivorans]